MDIFIKLNAFLQRDFPPVCTQSKYMEKTIYFHPLEGRIIWQLIFG